MIRKCREPDVSNIVKCTRGVRQKIAYISFKILGGISIWASYLVFTEIRASNGEIDGIAGVIGIGVFVLLGIPLLLAVILGPFLSLTISHDRNLMVMTGLTFILILLLGVLGSTSWAILLLIYGVVCLIMSTKSYERSKYSINK